MHEKEMVKGGLRKLWIYTEEGNASSIRYRDQKKNKEGKKGERDVAGIFQLDQREEEDYEGNGEKGIK